MDYGDPCSPHPLRALHSLSNDALALDQRLASLLRGYQRLDLTVGFLGILGDGQKRRSL